MISFLFLNAYHKLFDSRSYSYTINYLYLEKVSQQVILIRQRKMKTPSRSFKRQLLSAQNCGIKLSLITCFKTSTFFHPSAVVQVQNIDCYNISLMSVKEDT